MLKVLEQGRVEIIENPFADEGIRTIIVRITFNDDKLCKLFRIYIGSETDIEESMIQQITGYTLSIRDLSDNNVTLQYIAHHDVKKKRDRLIRFHRKEAEKIYNMVPYALMYTPLLWISRAINKSPQEIRELFGRCVNDGDFFEIDRALKEASAIHEELYQGLSSDY